MHDLRVYHLSLFYGVWSGVGILIHRDPGPHNSWDPKPVPLFATDTLRSTFPSRCMMLVIPAVGNDVVIYTWWLIPLSKWVITPIISGLTLLIPFITGVITHLRAVGWATKYPPSAMLVYWIGSWRRPGGPVIQEFPCCMERIPWKFLNWE